MHFSLDKSNSTYQIQSYTPGLIVVNGQEYNTPILIGPNFFQTPWEAKDFNSLKQTHFSALLPYRPTLILLGTGKTLRFPPARIFADLYEHQIGVEVMDTSAASRTYTLLSSEGRSIIAGLLL